MTTRKYSSDIIEDLYREINKLNNQVDKYLANVDISAPFRDPDNLPPGVEGMVVIAGATDVVTPYLGYIVCTAYRSFAAGRSVFTIDADTGTIFSETFYANISGLYPEYRHGKWSRDRTKILAWTYNDDVGPFKYEIWESNPWGDIQSMLGTVTDPSMGSQNVAMKETADDGIKFAIVHPATSTKLRIYDIPGTTSSIIFDSSSAPTGWTNNSIRSIQWNENGSKLSFWITGAVDAVWTINRDGTGLEGPIFDEIAAYEEAAFWQPGSNKLAYINSSLGINVINFDGTGDTNIVSEAISSDPMWNFDGTKMAWQRNSDGLIRFCNADGTSPQTIANSLVQVFGSHQRLAWSQDGNYIANIDYNGSDPTLLKILDTNTLDLHASYNVSGLRDPYTIQWFTNQDWGDF